MKGILRHLSLPGVVLISVIALSSSATAAATAAVIVPDSDSVAITESIGAAVYLTVYDADDNPVPFPAVKWLAPASGPSVTFSEIDSNEEGRAAAFIQSIGGMGTFQITASIDGVTTTINVTTYADPLRIVSGSHQTTLVNGAFAEPLVVQTRTLDGTPIAGATVTFTATGVTPSATMRITGGDGLATITLTAGSSTGQGQVIVSAGSVEYAEAQEAKFGIALVNAQSIQVFSGSGQEVTIGGGVRTLKARVFGTNGQPLRNAAVTFTSPSTGPGVGRFAPWFELPFLVPNGARVFTDDQGEAVTQVAANGQPGSYVVAATVPGVTNAANFSLTNVVRHAAAILPNGATQAEVKGEQAPIGGRFNRIRLRVVDADGAPVGGVVVTLTPPSTGASVLLDQSVLVSDAEGWIETQGTANTIAGYYYLAADTEGVDTTYMYLVNTPPGFAIGDQIADLSAADHTGTIRSLRSFTNNGSYVLIDVCTVWCTACQGTQAFGQTMKSQLAGMGIPIAVVPVLIDSATPGQPSTQTNAVQWRTSFQISDPVLHASGDPNAAIRQSQYFLLGAQPGFPTFLLISPDGTILDRKTGGIATATQMRNFVLSKIPSDVSITSSNVTEGSTASITVARSSSATSAQVAYSTSIGSAGATDFTVSTGTITFAAGQSTATITVPTTNDVIDESNEQFTVSLSNPVNLRIANGVASITIIDNDDAPSISMSDARYAEGSNGGPNVVSFPVRLDRPSAFTVTATYLLVAGTAKSTDVTLTKDIVKFAAGQTTAMIPITLIGDKTIESKETFTVQLFDAKNGSIATTEASVDIVDDDSDTEAPIIEAKSDVIVEIKMSSSSTVVVDYKAPAAIDKVLGAVPVTCIAPSGAKHGYGTDMVTCTAEDKAGNLATRKFNIIVRLPTVAGALFDPAEPGTPLTKASRGDDVLVQVGAGAFVPGASVTLAIIDGKGKTREMGMAHARQDGSLDHVVQLPHGTAPGDCQVLANSDHGDGEYDRSWLLTILKKQTTEDQQ